MFGPPTRQAVHDPVVSGHNTDKWLRLSAQNKYRGRLLTLVRTIDQAPTYTTNRKLPRPATVRRRQPSGWFSCSLGSLRTATAPLLGYCLSGFDCIIAVLDHSRIAISQLPWYRWSNACNRSLRPQGRETGWHQPLRLRCGTGRNVVFLEELLLPIRTTNELTGVPKHLF